MKTGILVHSRHLQAPHWEGTMWGEPPCSLGLLPKAILTALRENAEIMVLGCGLKSGINGEMESLHNRDYILRNFCNLADFSEFQGICLFEAKRKIEEILALDMESLNTAQEVRFSGRIFEGAGLDRVISVACPTHAPRCLNEALKFYGRLGSRIPVGNVLVFSSNIGWASNEEVMVFEPPHRPDDTIGSVRQKIAKMLVRPEKLQKVKEALGL